MLLLVMLSAFNLYLGSSFGGGVAVSGNSLVTGKLFGKLMGQRVHSARLTHCLLVTLRSFQPP
jgi:hypothetical protein